ncbi:hypothetical protein F5051DRAFT_231075 [Lentinula edodes]|nr:hypothetical protein F5051DRAFT_231075 [Lentinula edodes]
MDIKGIGDRCDRLCFVYALCAKNYIFTSFVFLYSAEWFNFIYHHPKLICASAIQLMASAVGLLRRPAEKQNKNFGKVIYKIITIRSTAKARGLTSISYNVHDICMILPNP